MQISKKTWKKYISKLSAVDKKAASTMQIWVDKNGLDDIKALIDYAYSLCTKYGEASAELACDMYDTIATVQKAKVPDAVPAATATYGEVAQTMYSTAAQPSVVSSAIGRLARQAGADTMLQNAKRDGAEFAWIPSGDSCSFCITLASRGWQRASSKTVSGDHADHIHNNCDCTFAIRFDGKSTVEGYDPDEYLEQYQSADGTKWKDKINSMRRDNYAQNKDKINEQKRAAYAARQGNSE